MNRLLWRLARMVIRHRRGRVPPASLTGPVWYFAYGSNTHERVFREARHMTPLETRTARLDGYRLRFAEGRPSSGYLSRIREAGRQRGLPAEYIAFLDSIEARQ